MRSDPGIPFTSPSPLRRVSNDLFKKIWEETEMLMLDRRALIRSAAVGSAVAAFASAAAEAASNGNYYVIAELVAKPDKADALRELLVPFVAGGERSLAACIIPCWRMQSSLDDS